MENKFEVFKQFASQHNYKFRFVGYQNDELYINNTGYLDAMNDNSWTLLEEECKSYVKERNTKESVL